MLDTPKPQAIQTPALPQPVQAVQGQKPGKKPNPTFLGVDATPTGQASGGGGKTLLGE